MLKTADYDYVLPPELIAQHPTRERDESRLLVVHRDSGRMEHRTFKQVTEYLKGGDVLVLNNSRVIPARLRGKNLQTGGAFELLLLEETKVNNWWVMLRPGKRARTGTRIALLEPGGQHRQIIATVAEVNAEGHRRVEFSGTPDIQRELDRIGEVPLPPYIDRAAAGAQEQDRQRYQTVYAEPGGSVAAPTAGLHFTAALLEQIRAAGVHVGFITLHVGLGTFAPVKSDTPAGHVMHEERYELSEHTAELINCARRENRRVIAVGTTSVRVLESAARAGVAEGSPVRVFPQTGRTRIFIYPPYRFQIVDGLLTNFHLPRSTLLMLVSALGAPGETHGRDLILSAYAEAIRERYRFYSYGDAMLIL